MKILVSNDDGFYASGLLSLVKVLLDFGEVYVAAPDRERSAVGHGITVHHPLRIKRRLLTPGVKDSFTASGTPADCVKLALQALNWKPDIVFSGINRGANVGTDVLYSGTVSAALEARLLGYPGVAVSLCGYNKEFFPTAARAVRHLLVNNMLPVDDPGVLYNVNVPCRSYESLAGFRLTHQGLQVYSHVFEERRDPRGRPYYWLAGQPEPARDDLNMDIAAVAAGYVSVTPLQPDLTDHKKYRQLRTQFVGVKEGHYEQ